MEVDLITSNLAVTIENEVTPIKLQTLTNVDISCAYVTKKAINFLDNVFGALQAAGIPVRIITTLQRGVTDVEALEDLRQKKVKIRIFKRDNPTFHMKAWLFSHRNGGDVAIVGSSNMTKPALTVNFEWNVRIAKSQSFRPSKMFQTFRDTFDAYWNDNDRETWESYSPEKRKKFVRLGKDQNLDGVRLCEDKNCLACKSFLQHRAEKTSLLQKTPQRTLSERPVKPQSQDLVSQSISYQQPPTAGKMLMVPGNSNIVDFAPSASNGLMSPALVPETSISAMESTSTEELQTVELNQRRILATSFSKDARLQAMVACDDIIKLWDTGLSKQGLQLHGTIYAAVLSPDGTTLAVISTTATISDVVVRVLNTSSKQVLCTFEASRFARAVTFSPNGELLMFASKSGLTMRSLRLGKELYTLKSTDAFLAMTFSPDGMKAAVSSDAGVTSILRTSDGSVITRLRSLYVAGSLTFLPGDKLGVVYTSGKAAVLSISSGEVLQDVASPESLSNLFYLPHANLMATVTRDWSVMLGNPESGQVVDAMRYSGRSPVSPFPFDF